MTTGIENIGWGDRAAGGKKMEAQHGVLGDSPNHQYDRRDGKDNEPKRTMRKTVRDKKTYLQQKIMKKRMKI